VGRLVDGFFVSSFWAALGGSLIVSVTNLALSSLVGGRVRSKRGPGGPPATKKDDVIDI
jgi:putative membrane protein